MHVQNRELKNTLFLPMWVFGSQELEDHRMQRCMVRLSQTTRSVQPLCRSHVDLSVIGLAGEDAPADLAFGEGEEDLRRLEMEPILLRCDGGFRCWSSSRELYDAEAEAGQERQR